MILRELMKQAAADVAACLGEEVIVDGHPVRAKPRIETGAPGGMSIDVSAIEATVSFLSEDVARLRMAPSMTVVVRDQTFVISDKPFTVLNNGWTVVELA